jgi:PleD family two-component response regulator
VSIQKILVADDDPHIAELVRVNLESRGYRIFYAQDGAAAIETAERESPDLILLDITMPKMDGFEVCRRLRESESTRLIPVLVLSARDRPVDKIAGLKLGADDYMTKPFDVDELLARVEAILRRNEQCLAANPLTGLPGNVSIMMEVNRRMKKDEEFAFLYLDIDNFKAYNDKYGFMKGDDVLKHSADLFKKCAAKNDFIGHVGGDDFVLICGAQDAEPFCREFIRMFDHDIRAFYDPADAGLGYIESRDRRGNPQQFPIMTVSLGVVIAGKGLREYGRIVQIATELKKAAKGAQDQMGSRFFIDRRR